MTDDIVTRPEQEMDFVEYLRLWASVDANDQAVRDLHKAADEIEYLRKDRDKWKRLAIENDKIAQIEAGIYPPIPHYEEVNKHE